VIGVDTSFLVGLTVREHPSHAACLRVFEEEIQGRGGSMTLSAQVLAEFCHVITDARRFERPLAMTEAIELCETLWNAAECRPVAAGADAGALFLTWMHEHALGRKRLLDTLLAATLHAAGVERLATTDWRDFEVYGAFDLVRV
jgi:predicted nucleic acid-binding protein